MDAPGQEFPVDVRGCPWRLFFSEEKVQQRAVMQSEIQELSAKDYLTGMGKFDMQPFIENSVHSEFEVQAEAYFRLRHAFDGITVRGEYHFKNPVTGARSARFDLVLLRGKDIRIIIEVKRHEGKQSKVQGIRYTKVTGRPVMYIRGMDQARTAVARVRQFAMQNRYVL